MEKKLHVIQEGQKYGFADEQGKIVIPCRWKEVDEFRYGMAPICNDEDRWGYIDTEGNIVIPCEWRDAELSRNGLGLVTNDNSGFYLYVDKAGNVICSSVYSEERALKIYESIKLAKQGKFKEAIELVYSVLHPIYDEDATALRLLINYSLASQQFETMVKILESMLPLRYSGIEGDVLFQIGVLYDKGYGVKQDFIKAYEWYKVAYSSLNDNASNEAGKAMDELVNEHPEIKEELGIKDKEVVDINDILDINDLD